MGMLRLSIGIGCFRSSEEKSNKFIKSMVTFVIDMCRINLSEAYTVKTVKASLFQL